MRNYLVKDLSNKKHNENTYLRKEGQSHKRLTITAMSPEKIFRSARVFTRRGSHRRTRTFLEGVKGWPTVSGHSRPGEGKRGRRRQDTRGPRVCRERVTARSTEETWGLKNRISSEGVPSPRP